MAAWLLHGLCCGEEAGARNIVFFRVKWLQATMKGTSSVRRLRLRSFRTRLVPPMGFAGIFVPVCVVLCVSWSCGADRIGMAAWLLHGLCCVEAGARNLVFFRVKWLQATMKGTSSVRRLRLRSFRTRLVPPMGFARIFVPVCVVLCVSWSCACRLHWSGCMNVAWAMLWGGSRSTKHCVFPCKVAAGDDERYLVCAAVAAAVVPDAIGSSYGFCRNLCSCVRSSMRFLKLWLQIALEWLHDCCMGYVVGRKPEHETSWFSVWSGCRRRWKVPRLCGGCGCGRSGRDWFLLWVLQESLFLCA